MKNNRKIAALIPALNEEKTIGLVLDAIPEWVDLVVVADNGSTDKTARVAAAHGATVAYEPRRGYGAACLAAMALVPKTKEYGSCVLVFLDGDFSDNPGEMGKLVDPIIHDKYDLVIGSRTKGSSEKGSLSTTQRFGNWLSCLLTDLFFGVQYSDLGPFRAITRPGLERLAMDDTAYGWTVQMQIRAARQGLNITEVPVDYRNRAGGKSKVSGTVRGIWGAGSTILLKIFSEALDAAIREKKKGEIGKTGQ